MDIARFCAALCIVGLHALAPVLTMSVGAAWASLFVLYVVYSALAFFFALSGFLHGWSMAAHTASWLRSRVLLLAGLLVAWSAIYAVEMVIHRLRHGGSLAGTLTAYLDLVSTRSGIHLWFLPALAFCTVAVWWYTRHTERIEALVAVCLALMAVYLSAIFFGRLDTSHVPLALEAPVKWLFFYSFGFALARGRLGFGLSRRVAGLAALLGLLSIAAGVWMIWHASGETLSVTQTVSRSGWARAGWAPISIGDALIALAALALVSRPGRTSGKVTRVLASCALGVYLVHPLLLTMWDRAFPLSRSTHAAACYVAWMVVGLGSTAVVLGASRVPRIRWLFRG
jgi:hypothetical protein